jgi:hypothetical protein
MSSVALLSVAGAAAVGLMRGAAEAVGGGLSFATELAKAAAPGETETAESPSALAAARAAFKQMIDQFAARVRQKLSSGGISLSQPLVLESDGLGGMTAGGNRPDQQAIDSLLSSDPLLERDFCQLQQAFAHLPDQAETTSFRLLVDKESASVVSDSAL